LAFRLGEDEEPIGDINVTPLVDVMLVLLIIFMITAPMMTRGIAVRLPESRTENLQQKPEKPLVLSIRADKALYLGEEPIAKGVLEERLRARLAGRKDKSVFLEADRSVPYGTVVEVLDALNRSGVDGIGMITKLPEHPRRRNR